jgi:predicted ABC-type ATPase
MPRIRLIAGPNGSGKTTLFKTLQGQKDVHFGQYINPDDVADSLKGFQVNGEIINDEQRTKAAQQICTGLRDRYLDQGLSLTYESVMSHKSHLDYIRKAKAMNFKPYLYYVCINDPTVNIHRVEARVKGGGHPVPKDKILSRYKRSLKYLYDMCQLCHRVYFFDNSNAQVLFAEKSENGLLKIKVSDYNRLQPVWFQEHVLDKWDTELLRYV